MSTLCIDPGVKCVGYAIGNKAEGLTWCGLLRADTLDAQIAAAGNVMENARMEHAVDTLICEEPQVYQGRRQKGRQNDLVRLTLVVGAYSAAALQRGVVVQRLKPRAWKGTVPGDVMTERIKKRLTPREYELAKKCLSPAYLAHNGYDAIGMLLHGIGRL